MPNNFHRHWFHNKCFPLLWAFIWSPAVSIGFIAITNIYHSQNSSTLFVEELLYLYIIFAPAIMKLIATDRCTAQYEQKTYDEHLLQLEAERLVDKAGKSNLVLTIEQKPLLPLRGGNYESVVSVRKKLSRV